jgi:hypothetical protein
MKHFLWFLFFIVKVLTDSPLKIQNEEFKFKSNEKVLNVTWGLERPGFLGSITFELLKDFPNIYVSIYRKNR